MATISHIHNKKTVNLNNVLYTIYDVTLNIVYYTCI